MGIRKSTFTGVELTRDDAIAFREQIRTLPGNPYAESVGQRGRKLAEEYASKGRAVIPVNDFVLQPLTKKHEVSHFSVGDEVTSHELFLKQAALNFHKSGLAKTFVLTQPKFSGTKVWGYITLTMSEIFLNEDQFSTEMLGVPKYESFPSVKIIKLAIDEKMQRKGLGRLLLDWAINHVQISMTKHIGCRYVMVDAYRKVIPFYTQSGFHLFDSDMNRREDFPLMFLDLYG